MPNTDWKKLEGTYFRIDVGTPKADALAATDNEALLHICTDNALVMNGEIVGEKNLPTVIDLGNFDTESDALNALADTSVCGDLSVGFIHLTYEDSCNISCIQSVENKLCRQVIFNKTRVFQRSIYFTDFDRQQISWKEDWQFIIADRLKYDSGSRKLLLSQFGYTVNADYTDALPLATTSVDGLMSKEDKALLEELKTKVETLEDNNTYK